MSDLAILQVGCVWVGPSSENVSAGLGSEFFDHGFHDQHGLPIVGDSCGTTTKSLQGLVVELSGR